MKILAVEDDLLARKVLVQALHRLGFEVAEATDGVEALRVLEKEPCRVIVSDWLMPEMDGLEFCRQLRGRVGAEYAYFILLTCRSAVLVFLCVAFVAGEDDFLSKPLDLQELWMRLRVAERILKFTTQVQQLEAFLPICSYCKKVRDDHNYWTQIEAYINQRTGSEFSHSICPDCYNRIIVPEIDKMKNPGTATATRAPRAAKTKG